MSYDEYCLYTWCSQRSYPFGKPRHNVDEDELFRLVRHVAGNDLCDLDAVRAVVNLVRRHRSAGIPAWGPSLVRAVLSGDDPTHARRTVEERRALIDLVRRLIDHSSTMYSLEPRWQDETLAALEEVRGPFLAGAKSGAWVAYQRRLDAVAWMKATEEHMEGNEVPHPEPLDFAGVDTDITDRVLAIHELAETVWAHLRVEDPLRDELRSITRRLLSRMARLESDAFRRSSRDDTWALGLVILVAHSNGVTVKTSQIGAPLGVRSSGGSARVAALVQYADVEQVDPPRPSAARLAQAWAAYRYVLSDPALQTSATRALVRDTYRLTLDQAPPTETEPLRAA